MGNNTIQPAIHIDVISDITCPWCYIGKKRLEKAVEELSDSVKFTIEYHPFELNPHIPPEGFDQREFLINKFGSPDHYERTTGQVTQIAAQEGLTFNFEKQTVMPNTRRLHALMLFAKGKGKQLHLVDSFFKAYFTDGIDLSRAENIVKFAYEIGMERAEAETVIADDRSMTLIAEAEKNVQSLGINAVPFYILNSKYGVSGAQPAETFIKTFEEILGSITAA